MTFSLNWYCCCPDSEFIARQKTPNALSGSHFQIQRHRRPGGGADFLEEIALNHGQIIGCKIDTAGRGAIHRGNQSLSKVADVNPTGPILAAVQQAQTIFFQPRNKIATGS